MRAGWLALPLLVTVLGTSLPSAAAPVAVRYAESASRGFVVLRAQNGDVLAHGELVQMPRGDRIESRLTFRFKDGSLWDETLTFTQQRVFRLMTYHHVQRGKSFPSPHEVAFDRDTGRYRARVGDDKDEGKVELPEDLHNGLTGTLLRNLAPGAGAAGHILIFTPTPRMLDTQLRAEGQDRFFVGDVAQTATRYLMKMELRGVTGVVASILGKDPPEIRFWIADGTVPAFVKFEGAFYLKGPRWRVELTAARWPDAASR